MNSLALALALVALGLGSALGQAPVINGPAGTYTSTVTLAAPGPIPIAGTYTGPQGLYSITLPAGSTITTSDTGVTITFGPATAPAPPVAAPPVPSPTPPADAAPALSPAATPRSAIHMPNAQTATPPGGPLFVAFVTGKGASSVPGLQLALKTSPTIAGALKAINPLNQWSVLDSSDPLVAVWAASVHAAPPPYILVFTPNGNSITKVEVLPATTEEPALGAEVKRLASGGSPR
jgi:hypothetical protein